MINFEQLKLYKQYLNTIQRLLDEYFEDQKEYIYCKQGCAHCCKRGQYPFSKLEFEYLTLGLLKINAEKRESLIQRVEILKKEYANCEKKKDFSYKCPFLDENDTCIVYEYRGLICRTFGLLNLDKNNEINMPFCQSLGLNYSEIYNRKEKLINLNLAKEKGYKNPPRAYKLNAKTLMNQNLFKEIAIDFGEIKPLIDWL